MEPFNAYESIVSLDISAMRYAKIAIRMSFRSITIPDLKRALAFQEESSVFKYEVSSKRSNLRALKATRQVVKCSTTPQPKAELDCQVAFPNQRRQLHSRFPNRKPWFENAGATTAALITAESRLRTNYYITITS
ncbi:hypothetical protein NC652_022138 [Populus alba x Populus x berolinensis]|nr:hypothetical protein NC652_022138 [Populus alba x Populus x berolinensis]